MSRADIYDFTLDEETEKRLYDLLTDIDTRRTNIFWVKDKRGYHAEYVKVIRCKDCKFVGTDATCCLVCKRDGMGLKPFHVYHDDYCSYAERKEE